MMTMTPERVQKVIGEAVQAAQLGKAEDSILKWIVSLNNSYPTDIGVLSPLYLNLICLSPGEAMFLPAGQLHAYLDGLGMELMANSDNVLRGGLTPKHMDVPELVKSLRFEEREIEILTPEEYLDAEKVYAGQAEEFVLSIIEVKNHKSYKSIAKRSVEILFCSDGDGNIRDLGTDEAISFSKGSAFVIPAVIEKYIIAGDATLYKAAVPI
jgi:mannose-6-phosphate isomerase